MQATAEVLDSPVSSDAYVLDPIPVIARLRSEDPVHFVPGLGFWLVTRYDDVRRLFTDPDIDRDTADLTIFGHGPHYRLGVHLALAELRGVVDAALDFLPLAARFREDLVEWQRIRRPLNLPIDFGN